MKIVEKLLSKRISKAADSIHYLVQKTTRIDESKYAVQVYDNLLKRYQNSPLAKEAVDLTLILSKLKTISEEILEKSKEEDVLLKEFGKEVKRIAEKLTKS